MLGWSPATFWASTAVEVHHALDSWRKINTVKS